MIPFLHEDLHELLRAVLVLFVKPSVLQTAYTTFKLCNIDLDKSVNIIDTKSVCIGFCASNFIGDHLKKDTITNSDVTKFKNDSAIFLTKDGEKNC